MPPDGCGLMQIDGVIHSAARRGMLADAMMQSELVRLVSLYLADSGEAAAG
jgi:hypothetical protein